LILNNIEVNSRKNLLRLVKKIDIQTLEDIEDDFEKWFELKITDSGKILILNIIKVYKSNRILSICLFFKTNNILDFSEERFKKYMNYIELHPKDKVSKDYYKLRYGKEYEIYYNNRIKNGALSKEKFISKYGDINGIVRYDLWKESQKKSSKRTIGYWLNIYENLDVAKKKLKEYQSNHTKKHLSGKSEEYIKEYNQKNSPWRVEYYLNRGYTEKEAKEIISKIKKESSMFCSEYYQKLGHTIEESNDLSYEYWKEHCYKNNSNVSKESLKIFSVIYERIKDLTNICVYYGDPKIDKKEYFLYDKSEKRYYFYDFTILKDDLKIIIEYNGSKFHPRKYSLTEEEWKNWRCLFNEDIDADTKYKYDCKKRDLALDNGFQYLEIWSDDVFDSNIEKSIDFILQSLQNVV
jgi:hypothetical protein